MWLSGKKYACQYRRCRRFRFDPWVRKIPWRRKWQPTPVFLPGKSHGQRSLAGYCPWGHKESDTTERLNWTELMLRKIELRRGRGWQRISWLDGITDSMDMCLDKLHSFLEKAMAPHSSTLAWKIPWTEDPGGLQSMGLQWFGNDLVTKQEQHISDLKKWTTGNRWIQWENEKCLWRKLVTLNWSRRMT